jgi:hypothetical protein
MGMAKKIEELRKMSMDELIRAHDSHAQNTVVGTQFYLDEIVRREAEAQTQAMIGLTKRLEILTWVIMFLTLVNAVAALLMFFR